MHKDIDITDTIVEAITDKKGKKVTIIDLAGFESASTHKLIICQGNSTSQVGAIADSVREKVAEDCKTKPANTDGYRNSQWIIVDYGDIMVHVFLPDVRQFYSLETLWNDAPVEVLPDID